MERIRFCPLRIRFRAWYIQIDHNWLLPAPDDYSLDGLVRSGIQLLMRQIGRNVNEIARASLINKFQAFAPAKTRAPFHHVNNSFELSMMMSARPRVWVDDNRSRPQFLRAHSSV